MRMKYEHPHLPQGAPTSPAIANLCVFRLDLRLAGLARAAGAQYTRYADDLAMSGEDDFARYARWLVPRAAAIATDEGFAVNHRKTRIMRRSQRQHLAGVVLNQRPNIRREQFDQLKATLFNCVQRGPASENRDGHSNFRAHLAGRIAHVQSLHAARGKRPPGAI